MANETLQITATNGHSGVRVLHLRRPLNIHTVFNFQTTVRSEEAQAPAIVVDFGGVPNMDSAGLGAVVGAYVSAQRQQRKIAFSGMNERVQALVSMSHLTQLFKPFDTVEEAERAIAAVN